jgi:hypothetical protein
VGTAEVEVCTHPFALANAVYASIHYTIDIRGSGCFASLILDGGKDIAGAFVRAGGDKGGIHARCTFCYGFKQVASSLGSVAYGAFLRGSAVPALSRPTLPPI